MKIQIQKSKPESHTIQSKTKAVNQVDMHIVLQKYSAKAIQMKSEKKSLDNGNSIQMKSRNAARKLLRDNLDKEFISEKDANTVHGLQVGMGKNPSSHHHSTTRRKDVAESLYPWLDRTKDTTDPLQLKNDITAQLMDLEEEEPVQGKFETAQCEAMEEDELLQGKFENTVQRVENSPLSTLNSPLNKTGLLDNLKSGVENLSGYSMDNVRVHYNSSKPATVQALAYTQGSDIHVAPGQEQHLPHEAWHVAQQMAGRVQPTTEIGGMPVNDNVGLEHEADVMGARAMQRMSESVQMEKAGGSNRNAVRQNKSNGKQGFGVEDNRVNEIMQLMPALLNKSIDINTESENEDEHSFAVSIGKTKSNSENIFGHSAIMMEGYHNQTNNHWLKFGEFYPKDAAGTTIWQKIKGVDGVINAQKDGQAAKEIVGKYSDIDVHNVKGKHTIEQGTSSFHDSGVADGPIYKLVTFNCSHWVKKIAGKMGINVGACYNPTPQSLLINDKRSRRFNKFDENKLDETYEVDGHQSIKNLIRP